MVQVSLNPDVTALFRDRDGVRGWSGRVILAAEPSDYITIALYQSSPGLGELEGETATRDQVTSSRPELKPVPGKQPTKNPAINRVSRTGSERNNCQIQLWFPCRHWPG
jgi:hypothetical protein